MTTAQTDATPIVDVAALAAELERVRSDLTAARLLAEAWQLRAEQAERDLRTALRRVAQVRELAASWVPR